MERLVSSAVTRPHVASVRCLPQLILATRATHKAHRESFLNASSSNYIDEIYEQWSKDPHSVHKVRRIQGQNLFSSFFSSSSPGIFTFEIKFINDHQR